jgi:CRP-like cAMP-binding protein
VAGTNKVLREGQVLFRAGDKSDGMYLIRKGEIRVYLEQDGKEVALATIGAGGMVGEMALFDHQPRSASVKASKPAEVTLISTDDFGKLMKQIPKWFVGLMSALSTRLRQTNERLKKVEAGVKPKPYQSVLRSLNVLMLLWARDGEKDGKDSVLQKAPAEKLICEVFGEDPEKLRHLFEALVREKVLTTRQDSYKNVVFVASNRAMLGALAGFIQAWIKANPQTPCLPDGTLAMLRVLERLTLAAPYDTSTVSLPDLIKEGKRDGYNVEKWDRDIQLLQNGGEEVKLVKTSSGPGLRTCKKDIPGYLKSHETLAAIYKSNLA